MPVRSAPEPRAPAFAAGFASPRPSAFARLAAVAVFALIFAGCIAEAPQQGADPADGPDAADAATADAAPDSGADRRGPPVEPDPSRPAEPSPEPEPGEPEPEPGEPEPAPEPEPGELEPAPEPEPGEPEPAPDPQPGDLPNAACVDAVERLRRAPDEPVACERWPGDCLAELNPCCDVYFICVDGRVERQVACDDDCAQGCQTYAEADCALDPACAMFYGSVGCGPAPEGTIEGPVCAPRRGDACSVDAECPDGLRCQMFWIDPCAGQNCDACGGQAGFCVR